MTTLREYVDPTRPGYVTTPPPRAVTPADLTSDVLAALELSRLVHLRGGVQSQDGTAISLMVADPTGPNGVREFLLTVREV